MKNKSEAAGPSLASTDAAVTIRDIAHHLGISHATVSRALAGHPRISALTKAQVVAAASAMGYVANASARTIRSKRSTLVGFVVPDFENDFYASVAKCVADLLAAKGFQLALSVTEDNPERETRDVRALIEARAAGIIVTPSVRPTVETIAMLRNVRAIQLVRRHPMLETDGVVIDDRKATYLATRHLLRYGHQAIAYVGGTSEISSGALRLRGCQQAMEEAGLDPPITALGAPRPEFARHAVTKMLQSNAGLTGLVLGSSELTLGALQALQAMGARLPDDISLVGYGDPAWFSLVGGGLTTVSLPISEIASIAVHLMISQLTDDGSRTARGKGDAHSVEPTLVLRESTRKAPST